MSSFVLEGKRVVGTFRIRIMWRVTFYKKIKKKKNIYIYIERERILHGKCWRTVFTHELLTYQKSNE